MGLKLYVSPETGPSRAVIMVIKELKLEERVEMVTVNIIAGEQQAEDFKKMNPQACVPTLVDEDEDGFVLWESRAIMRYLCDKYGSGEGDGNALYPRDPKRRATIDRMLDFDLGKIARSSGDYIYPKMCDPTGKGLEPKLEAFKKTMTLMDTFLAGSKYLAGDQLSLADLSILARLGCAELVGFEFTPYENVTRWMGDLAGELAYHDEVNTQPLKRMKEFLADPANHAACQQAKAAKEAAGE